jgi:hypothetical protein
LLPIFLLAKLLNLGVGKAQKTADPVAAKLVAQDNGVFQTGLGEVELLCQQRQILHLDLVVGNKQLAGIPHPSPPRGIGIQGIDLHLAGEELPQPLDGGGLPILAGRLPAILRVHIKNQVYRRPFADDTRQDQAGQKGFAGTGLAEDAVAALHPAIQIQTNGHRHVQGLADGEVAPSGVVFPAEDGAKVQLPRLVHLGKVGRHRFHRQQLHRLGSRRG